VYAFNQTTVEAFTDELVKIGSINELEKDAILGRLLGNLSPKMMAAAHMGEHEIANIAGKGGLGALRGAGRSGMATQAVKGGLGAKGLQRATSGLSVGAGRIGI
jgi:hypothetical protein